MMDTLIGERFRVIYADPPWSFDNVRTGGSHKSGSAQKYPTMALSELQAVPLPAVFGPVAVLFLWVPTALKFSHGGPTLEAWGFRYVTTVYWDKQRNGMGFWFRNYVEELLVGVRGDYPPFRSNLPNIVHIRAGGHSEKPEAFRRLIEDSAGTPNRRRNLELFGRRPAPGWTVTGLELTGRDVRDDLRLLAANAWTPGMGERDGGSVR